jgi:hypothetical protein
LRLPIAGGPAGHRPGTHAGQSGEQSQYDQGEQDRGRRTEGRNESSPPPGPIEEDRLRRPSSAGPEFGVIG